MSSKLFKKFKKLLKEYNQENNVEITFFDFLKILNYTDDDVKLVFKIIERKRKKSENQLPKKVEPTLSKYVGDRSNPEYDKYYRFVCQYRKKQIDEGHSISLKNFFKEVFNLNDEDALKECKKVQNIIYCRN